MGVGRQWLAVLLTAVKIAVGLAGSVVRGQGGSRS